MFCWLSLFRKNKNCGVLSLNTGDVDDDNHRHDDDNLSLSEKVTLFQETAILESQIQGMFIKDFPKQEVEIVH